MGCEGWITLVRVGDGQHLIPEWAPTFVVHADCPVAVLNVSRNRRLYRSNSLRPWTTHHDQVDAEAVDIQGVEGPTGEAGSHKVLVVPLRKKRYGEWEKAIIVASRAWLEAAVCPDEESKKYELCYSWESRVAIWDKLVPGLWAVLHYSESGLEDNVYYHCELPSGCEIKDTLNYELWT